MSKILWKPNEGRQHEFVSCPERMVLYGGAKGGGKSDGLIMAAVNDYESRWMRSLILRRTVPELKDLLRRSKELYYPMGGKFKQTTREWFFPSGGIMEFGYLEKLKDLERYQGRGFSFIGFDEIAQWPVEEFYTTMHSCLRTSKEAEGIVERIMATCNPIGAGRAWVQERWNIPDAGTASEVWDEQNKCWRVFIPSRVTDNPFLSDGSYMQALKGLPERLRRALLDGRWDVVDGAMFEGWNPSIHVCKPFPIPVGTRIWRGADDGFNAPACIHWFAEIDGRTFVIAEHYAAKMTSETMADVVLKRDKRIKVIDEKGNIGENTRSLSGTIDSSAFNEYDGSDSQNTGRGQRMNQKGCRWSPVAKGKNSRQAGWNMVQSGLSTMLPDGKPQLMIFSTCTNLLRVIGSVPVDKADPEDIDPEFSDDHALDSLRYGLQHKKSGAFVRDLAGF